jgi:hypothetical protein
VPLTRSSLAVWACAGVIATVDAMIKEANLCMAFFGDITLDIPTHMM